MNKLIKPLILLIILVALVLMVHYIGTDRSRPDADVTFQVKLDQEQIERVEISRGEAQVTLLYGVNGWSVRTPFGIKPAETETIVASLKDLTAIDNARLVSHNPEKQPEYRVDEAGGTRVKFLGSGDKVLADLVIGKLGGFQQQQQAMMGRTGIIPQALHTFMRHAGSDRVFKVQGFFATITGTEYDQWRDHNLCTFSADQVRKLSLAYEDETVVLEPDTAGSWSMLEPKTAVADPDTAGQIVRSLGTLRADGFQDSTMTDEELGFDSPLCRIAVELSEGPEVQLEIGREFNDNFFYARKVGDPQVYTLAGYRIDQIMKRSREIIAAEE